MSKLGFSQHTTGSHTQLKSNLLKNNPSQTLPSQERQSKTLSSYFFSLLDTRRKEGNKHKKRNQS